MLTIMKPTKLLFGILALISLAACHSKTEKKETDEKFIVTSPLLVDTSFTKEYVAEIQSVQNVEIRA